MFCLKLLELKMQSSKAIYKIETRLASTRGIGTAINYDIDDVMNGISSDEIRELLKVKAHLMGIALVEDFHTRKDYTYQAMIKLLEGRATYDNPYDFSEALPTLILGNSNDFPLHKIFP